MIKTCVRQSALVACLILTGCATVGGSNAELSQLNCAGGSRASALEPLLRTWVPVVRKEIRGHWRMAKNHKAIRPGKVRVVLDRSGAVRSVYIVQSSGNPVIDRTIIAAVNQSSPLPIPTDPVCYEYFRELVLSFRR